jgi:hypothetical protein
MSFTRSSIRVPTLAVVISLAAFALLVVIGRVTAHATLADGDVVLAAQPSNSCIPGSDVNCESDATGIVNSSGGNAFLALSKGSGTGVEGDSSSGTGVSGSSGSGYGVLGNSDSTVQAGVRANNTGSGPALYAQSQSGRGVEGHSGSGVGVLAVADGNPPATALKTQGASSFNGKTSFSRSGKITVSAGTSSATKTGVNLTSTSLVLATIQANQSGIYVQGVTQVAGTSGSFTIHLNKNTPVNLPVAWFIVN